MWDNKVLKQKAKERMKVNYWKMLLVGLIIALVSGGTGASSSARNYVTGDKETTQYDDYDEEYSGSYAEDYGEYNDDYDDEYDEAEPDEEYGEEEDR